MRHARGDRGAGPVAAPLRTCVGCRRTRPAGELVRVTSRPDGSLQPGVPGQGGRGAWLCADTPECLEQAARGGFSRAFRRPVAPAEIEALRASLPERARIEVRPRVPGPPTG